MELKVHLQRVRGELQYNNNDFWKGKFQMRDRYPSLLLVIEVCLVIPVQTACCERGNSCLNRVMCDFRSTLDVGTVEALMRISLNGPNPLEYHSSLAVTTNFHGLISLLISCHMDNGKTVSTSLIM